MKKYLLFLLPVLIAKALFAAPRQVPFVDTIGPSTATNMPAGGNVSVNIASSTVSGSRTCLTNVSASVSRISVGTNLTLSVLDSATTIYAIDASTGNPVGVSWNVENPLCIAPGHQMNITVVPLTTTSTTTLNYQGYSY